MQNIFAKLPLEEQLDNFKLGTADEQTAVRPLMMKKLADRQKELDPLRMTEKDHADWARVWAKVKDVLQK